MAQAQLRCPLDSAASSGGAWRYDPIIGAFSPAWHLANFTTIAKALQGATLVVNTSFIEPYVKALRQ